MAEAVTVNTEGEKKKTEEEEKVTVAQEENATLGSIIKFSSFKEESNFFSDLKESEKKALMELKSMIEEAILNDGLFTKEEVEEKGENTLEAKEVKEAVNKEISLWGVPLLPTKFPESTNVILLKFLRAREFRVKEAFKMIQRTLQWRKESKIGSILNEESLGVHLQPLYYFDGADREGHPVCYNVYGVFQDEEIYQKAFGTEENRKQFLRWRVQVMEKGIQKLDFKPGGVASFFQVYDLKNSPWLAKKELKVTMRQAVELLQDNYPEFVAKSVFINVPFWYYAFNAVLSPFLTQRTRSKFVFARPSKVTETLLKYIPAEDIPISYGGLKRENDTEFSVDEGGVSELTVKAGSIEQVEIPVAEAGTTLIWDLIVLGWDVNYKEEFVPADEGLYTIIIQSGKKIVSREEPVRNSFVNHEPGKVVLTIENSTFKKKRVMFRCKAKSS